MLTQWFVGTGGSYNRRRLEFTTPCLLDAHREVENDGSAFRQPTIRTSRLSALKLKSSGRSGAAVEHGEHDLAPSLQAPVGIATGFAVGDLIGSEEA